MASNGSDTDDGPDARVARANVRDRLGGFEAIEDRPPSGQDIDGIVNSEVSGLEIGDPKDPFNLFSQKPVRPGAGTAYRPGDEDTTDGLFHQVQGVEDNRRQGLAAEDSAEKEIRRPCGV